MVDRMENVAPSGTSVRRVVEPRNALGESNIPLMETNLAATKAGGPPAPSNENDNPQSSGFMGGAISAVASTAGAASGAVYGLFSKMSGANPVPKGA